MKQDTTKFLILILTGFFWFLTLGQAMSLTIAQTSLQEITTESTIIVHGNIAAIDCQWKDDNHDFIYTFLTVEVDEYLKGNADSELTVRQLGGQIGEIGHHLAGAPIYEEDDEVVLFLVEFEGTYVIHSIALGSFRVFSGANRTKQVVNDLGNVNLIDPVTKEKVEPEDTNHMFDMEAFFNQIRSYVNQNKK